MDNVTHTLIGALLGETVARSTQPDPRGLPGAVRRNLLVATAAIGSNLPDSDLLYSFIGGKLNYLLHHRGHTHTILVALLLGLLTLAITRWWLRRRGLPASSQDYVLLPLVVAFLALLLLTVGFRNN